MENKKDKTNKFRIIFVLTGIIFSLVLLIFQKLENQSKQAMSGVSRYATIDVFYCEKNYKKYGSFEECVRKFREKMMSNYNNNSAKNKNTENSK